MIVLSKKRSVGRPKSLPTKQMRVPIKFENEVKLYIKKLKSEFLEIKNRSEKNNND